MTNAFFVKKRKKFDLDKILGTQTTPFPFPVYCILVI